MFSTAQRPLASGARTASEPRRRSLPLKALGTALLLELGLILASSATGAVTESRGFRDAFAQQLPLIWSSLEVVRRAGDPALLLLAGLVLASLGYALAIVVGPPPLRWIVGLTLLFELTLLLMPGLLSTDVLTYATYGRLAGVYGQNPYALAPSAIAADPLVQWLDTRPEHASPYGPVWTLLSAGLAWLTVSLSPLMQALSYRVLASLAHLGGMALVWRLNRDPTSLLLFAWNPLLLVENVGSGHNDGLMMVIVLAGVLLLNRAARAPGLLALALAALVKYVPALPLLYVSALQARRRPKVVLATLAASLLLGLVLWLPWVDPRQPQVLLSSVSSAGGERYVNALLDLPTGWIATHLIDRAGQDVAAAEASVRAWPRAIVRVLFAVYVALEAWRLWRTDRSADGLRPALEAALRSVLVLVLLVLTQVLPWYFTWPVALAAVLGWGSTLARVAVAYSVVYLPVFYAIHEDLVHNAAPWLLGYAILPWLMARRRPA